MGNTIKIHETMQDFQRHKGDTGSPEVQVAVLTARINRLAAHMKEHHHDHHSHRGLLGMVNKRRKLMKYLKRTKEDRYYDMLSRLKLRDIKTNLRNIPG